MTEFAHIPVMLRECIEGLAIKGDGIYVDCTLGGAGHSCEIASRLTTGKLIAFDKDAEAIEFAKQRLAPYADRVTLLKDDFKRAPSRLKAAGITRLDGVLMDTEVDRAKQGYLPPDLDIHHIFPLSGSESAEVHSFTNLTVLHKSTHLAINRQIFYPQLKDVGEMAVGEQREIIIPVFKPVDAGRIIALRARQTRAPWQMLKKVSLAGYAR